MVKLASMTLPYAHLSFERALEGIARAGYRYVSFGLPHAGVNWPDEEDAQSVSQLEKLFNSYQLAPVQLVSTQQLAPGQSVERIRARMQTAKELGIQEVLSLGTWDFHKFPDDRKSAEEMEPINRAFVEQFKIVAEEAARYDLIVTIKPHCGNTATASRLIETLDQIGSPQVRASYDPGNVEYYEGLVSHLDFAAVADQTISIIAKDHRGARANLEFPVPGTGDVDFAAIFRTWKEAGQSGNVVVERVDSPKEPEQIDEKLTASRIELERLLLEAGFSLK